MSNSMSSKTISIIGLGKLGSSMMVCFASKNFKIIGVDNNQKSIDLINKGLPPVDETNLSKYLKKYKKNILATSSYKIAIEKTSMTFIVVPTPTAKDGSYDLKILNQCLKQIASLLKNKKSYHTIILCSTVLPGDSLSKLIPLIEKTSKKKLKKDFGFVYSPEFISLGNIINEYLNPEIVLIGSDNKKDHNQILNFYKKIYKTKLFSVMSITEAELTKIAINSFMTMKISFANMIGMICKKMNKMNSSIVLNSINQFFSKFNKASKAGLGYGGPCLPRDNIAVNFLNKKNNIYSRLPIEIDSINNKMPNFLFKEYLEKYKNKKILLAGLSYKPETNFYEKSQTLEILKKLKSHKVSIFDFKSIDETLKQKLKLDTFIKIETNFKNAISKNDVIVLCHLDKRFKKINFKKKIVIDFWRQVEVKRNNIKNIAYF